jgi:ribosome biogenesis protein Nip4
MNDTQEQTIEETPEVKTDEKSEVAEVKKSPVRIIRLTKPMSVGRELTEKEKAKRKTRNKMAKASRKRNR